MGGGNFWPLWSEIWSGLLFKHLKITRSFILSQLTSCWHHSCVLVLVKEYLSLFDLHHKKTLPLSFTLVGTIIIISGGIVMS